MLSFNDTEHLSSSLRRIAFKLKEKQAIALSEEYGKLGKTYFDVIEENFINLYKKHCGCLSPDFFTFLGINYVDEKHGSRIVSVSYKGFQAILDLKKISVKISVPILLHVDPPCEYIFPADLLLTIDKLNENKEYIDEIYENAKDLMQKICSTYGSYKYILTQFPELQVFVENTDLGPINPHYRVRPRSSFNNPDSILKFLGEAAMEGIKP